MVDSGRQHQQIVFLHQNSNPMVVQISDVKVAASLQNEPDLLVGVNVLCEENFQLGLVIGQCRGGKFQLVLISVAPVGSKLRQTFVCCVIVSVELK